MSFLSGKKTFISAAALFITGGLRAIDVIDGKTAESAATIIEGIALWALRLAISKGE